MKWIVTIVILALLGWGAYALMNRDNTDESGITNQESGEMNELATSTPSTSGATSTPAEDMKEFTVTGSSFSFAPANMEVNRGDRVRVTFKNSGGNHNWVLDEFNVKTEILASGASETVEFVADKTGSFEYYCSVGTHRQMGMKGTLIVR